MSTLQHPKGATISVSDADADFYLRNGWAVVEDGAEPLFPAPPPPTHEALAEAIGQRDELKTRVVALEDLVRQRDLEISTMGDRFAAPLREMTAARDALLERLAEIEGDAEDETEGETDAADSGDGDAVPEASAPGVRRRTR